MMDAVSQPMPLAATVVGRPAIAIRASFVVEVNARMAGVTVSAVVTTISAATGSPASTTVAPLKTEAEAASTTINAPMGRFVRTVIALKTTKPHARTILTVPTVNFAWSANVCSNVETTVLVPKVSNAAALAWVVRSVWSPSGRL